MGEYYVINVFFRPPKKQMPSFEGMGRIYILIWPNILVLLGDHCSEDLATLVFGPKDPNNSAQIE